MTDQSSDTPVDLGAMYRQSRLRIAMMVDEAVSAIRVPATPAWDVHDVIAHLAGVVEDVKTGNLDGVTTDRWTAAQVERNRHRSVTELLDQWAADAPMLEDVLSSPKGAFAFRAVLDIHTHECDLLNALGRPSSLPSPFLNWSGDWMRTNFEQSVVAAGLPVANPNVTDFDWFRGRLGRRSEAEVKAYAWPVDPTPYLDVWFIFGRAESSLDESSFGELSLGES